MKNKNKSLKKIERVIQFSNPTDLWEVEGDTAHVPLPLVSLSSDGGAVRWGQRKHRTEDLPLVAGGPGVSDDSQMPSQLQGGSLEPWWGGGSLAAPVCPLTLDCPDSRSRGQADAQSKQMAVTRGQGTASSMALSICSWSPSEDGSALFTSELKPPPGPQTRSSERR